MNSDFDLLKWWHQTATAEQLQFLLTPTDILVGVFTGSPGIWQVGEGYFHPEYNVLVDASRAGFNFFVIALLAFASLLLCRWRSPFAVLPALLLA